MCNGTILNGMLQKALAKELQEVVIVIIGSHEISAGVAINRIFSTDYRAKVATFLRDRARPAIQAEKENSLQH